MFDLQKLRESGWESDERSTSVKYDPSVVELGRSVAKGDSIKVNLPVCLTSQGDFGQASSVVILVYSAKCSFRLVAVAVVGVAKIECKDWLVEKSLVQHVVERWDNLVDADRVVAKTHDTIETAKCKGKTGLGGCFCKVLVLDFKITDLDDVLRYETAETTGAISDLELRAVLLVCRRRRRVVLGVEVARDGATLL